jgi:hypothetical protein
MKAPLFFFNTMLPVVPDHGKPDFIKNGPRPAQSKGNVMKTLIAIGSAATLALSLSTPALAKTTYEFTPVSKAFTATGTTMLTKGTINLSCTAKFVGKTTAAGVAEITSATFTGNILCGAVKSTGLPWLGTASSLTKATFAKVSVSASLFGVCGPSNVPVTVAGAGKITFAKVTLTPDCVVNGTITSKPALTIAVVK